MDWTEVKITVENKNLDKAAAIAQMAVPYGIYIEDYSALEDEIMQIAHIDLIDEDLLLKDRTKAVIHIYISPGISPLEALSFLSERMSDQGIAHEISQDTVKEEEWATAWMKYYHPVSVGKKLLVRPSWETAEESGRIEVILNPGMAFGTGTHETTRLCMELLEEYITPDSEMLDIGCGSGILAITSLLLGANKAVGVDLDPVAVKVAAENAELNGVKAAWILGDLTEKVTGRYDIVCANIVADIIIRLCDNVRQFMKPDAVFLCSGIIDIREAEVTEALTSAGFIVMQVLRENGWCAIACRQR